MGSLNRRVERLEGLAGRCLQCTGAKTIVHDPGDEVLTASPRITA